MDTSPTPTRLASTVARYWLNPRAVWRWHFYAGLLCIPFVLWLSATGALYLFKPQVESWIDRPYDTLRFDRPAAPAAAQVAAALAAVPGSVLHTYELPPNDHAAARVIVGTGTREVRVYVHPATLTVLKQVDEDDRLMRVIFRLHGELLLGDRGSLVVELAASWTIVMILSGLYLWWPRNEQGGARAWTPRGWAGVLYPRWHLGRRGFWRDIHAVVGFWISFMALFLLISGLPWAKNWGAYFKEIRQITGTAVVKQDWPTGRADELADRLAMNAIPDAPPATAPAGEDEHAGHAGHTHHPGMVMPAPGAPPPDYSPLDAVLATVAPLHLAPPVLISPPRKTGDGWTAKSDAQNRPLRTVLTLSPGGRILKREDFNQRHWIDQVVGTAVAAHEGQLFGWANQALGLLTALGLMALSVSGILMWLRRRPRDTPATALCPPPLTRGARHPARSPLGFALLLLALAIFLPVLGASMAAVLALEHLLLRHIPAVRDWLGLAAPARR